MPYANLTGKKDPCDIHIWCSPTHECLCDFFPQSLLIDILAMPQMKELPLSLRNKISPFAFHIIQLQSFTVEVRIVNLFVLCYNKFKLKEDNHSPNSKCHLKAETKIDCGQV